MLLCKVPATLKTITSHCMLKITAPTTSEQLKIIKIRQSSKLATFNIEKPFKLHKLKNGPSLKSELTIDDAIKHFEVMNYIRRLETVCEQLYKTKIIRGFCHMLSGQEAIPTGIHALMRKEDSLITSYRCHSYPYLMGWGIYGVLAELAGRKTGCSRGKGGSMHMYGRNFYGGNGIVGAQGPLGTGLALAHKYKNDGGVSFIMYGDGASNQGQLYEAFNIAKLQNLPAIYVCENNLYGMGTASSRSSANTDYYTRGDYIPGVWIDGMDVLAVKEGVRFAIDHCVKGKGPIVLEMQTYRYYGHSMSDPGTSYRTRDEVMDVRKTRDPILLYKTKLIAAGLATDDQLKAITKNVRKEIDEIAEKVKSDPFPAVDEVTYDVYASCLYPKKKIRVVLPERLLEHKNAGHKLPSE